MPSYHAKADSAEWQAVAEQLLGMLRLLEAAGSRPVNMLQFADMFAALSRTYLSAIKSEGRTSIRAEAVVKALDMKTPKSKLEEFVERRDLPESAE